MDILSILKLLGGVGLFLCGMNLMSSSLEKVAGSGLERILEKLTIGRTEFESRIKGWSLGAAVTGIIQSSAATTIMVSGFVNAGIMTLAQSLPVVFGSNVGSTVTSQILRLGDIDADNILLQLLQPSSFAPALVAIGAFTIIFSKKGSTKHIAGIIVGLGELFYGMVLMEAVFEPLQTNPDFQNAFTSFENPLLGFLVGLAITIVIQSSNATVGILQALTASGTITYAITIPVVIGINLGKCTPIVLGMIGSNKKAKSVSMGYLLFNLFGALLFMVGIYSVHYTIGLPFMSQVVTRGNIATFHFLFNFITSVLMLFFSQHVAKLCNRIVKIEENSEADKEFEKLDDMLLNTPTVALEQCKELISKMGNAIFENYKIATGMIDNYDAALFPKLEENENFIDKCESVLSSYIIRIDRKRLTEDDRLVMTEILNSVGDFERMGDYCMNIAYTARSKYEKNLSFSSIGANEISVIVEAVEFTLDNALTAFLKDDVVLARRIDPLSESIKELQETIKAHHVERLEAGICSIEGGVFLFDLCTCFERIASHSANVAQHVVKRLVNDSEFDEMHGHTIERFSEEYKALYHYYETMFIEPIAQHDVYLLEKLKEEEASVEDTKGIGQDKEAKRTKEDKQAKKAEQVKKAEQTKEARQTKKAEKTEKQVKEEKQQKADKASKEEKKKSSDKKGGSKK